MKAKPKQELTGWGAQPIQDSVNKAPAQAQHSPLPWSAFKYPDCKTWTVASKTSVASKLTESDAKFIVRACNNAQRLADTLEMVLDVITGDQAAEIGVYDSLAQWLC